jgi:hypothetical protein
MTVDHVDIANWKAKAAELGKDSKAWECVGKLIEVMEHLADERDDAIKARSDAQMQLEINALKAAVEIGKLREERNEARVMWATCDGEAGPTEGRDFATRRWGATVAEELFPVEQPAHSREIEKKP